ncbi:MAG: phage major capsid protein, partial [Alphaproteobacteria bacterium]|nr:phage major capsid protein [Alphaproteobacteria bacterium]
MIDMNEVHDATETLARAFEEYKSVNDQRLGEIERRGSADTVLNEKLGRMDAAM